MGSGDRDPLGSDVISRTVDQLETYAASLADYDSALETVRIAAQHLVYHSVGSRALRLRWARLALSANRRLHRDNASDQERMLAQEFMLRTWVILHLGPDPEPAWDPEALSVDTLAALTLDPNRAATDWTGLPIRQIRELRRHKNLTAHVDTLINYLRRGPTRERLTRWVEVRDHLP